MNDPPSKPPRPNPLVRSRAPSFPEVLDAILTEHSAASDPPGARKVQRYVGRFVLRGFRWTLRHWKPLAVAHAVGAGLSWLSNHLWHWMK